MIVCHCNRIDHREIEQTCQLLETADAYCVLTPTHVYKALGKRPRCGGCLTLAANLINDRSTRPESCCRICPMEALIEEAEVEVARTTLVTTIEVVTVAAE